MIGHERKVLVVGSNLPLRSRVVRALSELKCAKVDQASDEADAMEQFTVTAFDLLVVAWNETESALELVRRIRHASVRANTPVLLLGEDVTGPRVVAAMQAGASGVVSKPYEAEALRQKVTRLLSAW